MQTANETTCDLLRDAARWLLLAKLFECPSERWRRELAALADESDDAKLQDAARAALASATEGDYHSVFGPGGPAPPREVSYCESVELGSLMSELGAYYHAFGYQPVVSEPPDHVAVEIGFLAYLRLKQAHATHSGRSDNAEIARQAAERFRADHLATVAPQLASLLAASGIDYLAQASARLAARAASPRPRTFLPVVDNPEADDDGSEFPCCSAL